MKRAAASLALAGVLAGCGGPPEQALFPLDAGHRWSYRVTTTLEDGSAEPQVERVDLATRGRSEFGGAPAWKRTSSTGVAYWLRQDSTGVYRVATQGPLDPAPRPDAAARYVLKKPFEVGTTWDGETTSYVLQRRNEVPRELRHLPRYRTLPIRWRIAQLDDSVDTPAGRFAGCLRLEGTGEIHLYVDELFAVRPVPFTALEWYCPQVGLVRAERRERSPNKFMVGGTVVMELAAWR